MALATRFTYCTDTTCTTLEAQKQRSRNQKAQTVNDPLSSIGVVVSEEMFENVDVRRTDAGVIGILIAHLGAFGSGELKLGSCHVS